MTDEQKWTEELLGNWLNDAKVDYVEPSFEKEIKAEIRRRIEGFDGIKKDNEMLSIRIERLKYKVPKVSKADLYMAIGTERLQAILNVTKLLREAGVEVEE